MQVLAWSGGAFVRVVHDDSCPVPPDRRITLHDIPRCSAEMDAHVLAHQH
jgi:hypothetical protein